MTRAIRWTGCGGNYLFAGQMKVGEVFKYVSDLAGVSGWLTVQYDTGMQRTVHDTNEMMRDARQRVSDDE